MLSLFLHVYTHYMVMPIYIYSLNTMNSNEMLFTVIIELGLLKIFHLETDMIL